MNVKIAQTPEEIAACFDVLAELRPHLAAAGFVDRISAMRADGFELAFLAIDDVIVTVTGFRIFDNLCNGRTLYVDDLVTAAKTRSRGHGATMIEWLRNHARKNCCRHFSLDSGTQRVDAHRFYLLQRLDITDFHFAQDLD